MTGDVSLTDLIEYILRGGWPENISVPLESAMPVPAQYAEAGALRGLQFVESRISPPGRGIRGAGHGAAERSCQEPIGFYSAVQEICFVGTCHDSGT